MVKFLYVDRMLFLYLIIHIIYMAFNGFCGFLGWVFVLGCDVMRESKLPCQVGLVKGWEKGCSRVDREWVRLGMIKLGRDVTLGRRVQGLLNVTT